MKFNLLTLTLTLIALANSLHANPPLPGQAQSQPIALVGGTIHPVSGPDIPNGTILFENGQITAIGNEVAIPDSAQRVDITNQHIYPGLFEPYSHLGLIEIDAVRATRDATESGAVNPNVRAHVAVNPDSELIPVTRSNGVLLALTAPSGGVIAGQSAVLQLDGWTYEELTLAPGVGMHVQWPTMRPVLGRSDAKEETQRDPSLVAIEDAFEKARAYQTARKQGYEEIDARWDAMLPLLEGKMPLIIAADEIQQIQSALAFCQRQKVRPILLGGYDAPECAELMRKQQVPVIVTGVYRLPLRKHDDYDAAYTLPERLRAAGIKYCISCDDKFGGSNVRNLPYHAAMAAAHGLPRDEALKAITLYPAEILGVADRVGSLEVGKDATLILTTGDPLETTSQVRSAYVQGRKVDLNDRHKQLYRKYREKYRRLDAAKSTAP